MKTVGAAVLEGLRAPMLLIDRARATSAWPRYTRLVFRQALATLFVMSLVTPGILRGLDLAATHKRTDVRIRGVHVIVVDSSKRETRDSDDGGGGLEVSGASFISTHAPRLLWLWIALVSLYGSWLLVEWIVTAITYEYADDMSEELSGALGLPFTRSSRGRPARLRIDWRRQLRRVWRQVLAAIVFASGAPLFLAARLVPRIGHELQTATLTAWGLYWLLVTTASKSDLAWTGRTVPAPWFLRAWTRLCERVPGFRWFLPRAYGRLWNRVTVKMHGAADLLEEAPWPFLGLSTVRVLANLPLLGLVLRPLLPLAATLLVVTSRQEIGASRVA
jgi:hypothetical protein